MKDLILFFVLAVLVACSTNDPEPVLPVGPEEPKIEEQGSKEDLQQAMIDFGFKSFLKINEETASDENILISPLSIESALFMTSNGAVDETLDEIRAGLELGDFYPSGINQFYHEIMDEIKEDASDKTFLNSSQAVFWNKGMIEVFDAFKSNLETSYDAELYPDDFTLEAINGWANEKTEGRIPKVLDKINADEVMFIMNALYFLGDWDKPFDANATYNKTFNLEGGQDKEVPMMNNDFSFLHFDGDDMKAVDLLFADQKFAMSFIQTNDGINEFLNNNSFKELSSTYDKLVNDQMYEGRILLALPKFELKFKRNISNDLKSLGIERAFQEANAQFGNLGQAGGNIFLTRVIHDTFLKIDEKGAEGAAVTTVGVGVESVPQPIVFDNPFLVVIRHIDSGIPIFIGKIMDPS